MDVNNSFSSHFNIDKVFASLEKASQPEGSTLKVNEVVQNLMKDLYSGDILVVKEVLDPQKRPVWLHLVKNMEKLTPGAIPQFDSLINNVRLLASQYQKIFQSKDPEDLIKAWAFVATAINEKDFEKLDIYIHLGFNINQDINKTTPLSHAIMKENFEAIEYLVKKGANINAIDKDGWTPLKFAIFEDKPDLVAFLIKNGADPNLYPSIDNIDSEKHNFTQEPCLAYANALKLPHIAKQLIDAGADEEYTKEYLLVSSLASIWGIEENIDLTDKSGIKHQVRFEGGMRRDDMMENLCNPIESFFLSKKYGKPIIQAIHNSFPNQPLDSILRSIQIKTPSIILGGLIDHTIGFTIFQNKLCVCNRGFGGEDDAVEIFELPENIDIKFLETISDIYEDLEAFKEAMKRLNLKKIDSYRQKDQESGNCSVASYKAAVGAICRLQLGEKNGKDEYKAFTSHLRLTALNEYVKSSTSPNQQLLKAITLKVKDKKDKELVESTLLITLKDEKSKKRKKE